MASPSSVPKDSPKHVKNKLDGDKKALKPIEGDKVISQRIAYLWTASQAALETGNVLLSGIYLYDSLESFSILFLVLSCCNCLELACFQIHTNFLFSALLLCCHGLNAIATILSSSLN